MAMQDGSPVETVVGTVQATNPKGIWVNGGWWNWSQYGPTLPRPSKGQTIRLEAKGSFIRALDVVDGVDSGAPGRDAGSDSRTPARGAGRDATITRLAVLKAAAGFAAGRPDATSADVLRVAEAWEQWVMRAD